MSVIIRLIMAAATASCCAAAMQARITLISEDFNGSNATNLNGTHAGMVDDAILIAGGDTTWRAPSDGAIRADGSISGAIKGSAYLKLGSYIDSAMGSAEGRFILTATLTKPFGGGAWTGLGFFSESANDNRLSTHNFTDGALAGMATAVHRRGTDTGANFFAGPQSFHPFDPGNLSADVTFSIELDFTPAGGYNGISNFGTVRFRDPLDLSRVRWSHTYEKPVSIRGVGFGYAGSLHGGIETFSLIQEPIFPAIEPRR